MPINPMMILEHPDPAARLGFPPTLPLELALKTAGPKELCESYGITQQEWRELIVDKTFIQAVKQAVDLVGKEGVSFKTKAKAQAEMLLLRSWVLIHDDKTPPSVQADLLKFTIKVAGYDPSLQKDHGNGSGTSLTIEINL